MFLAGIAGAGGMATLLGVLLAIFIALIIGAVLIYTMPARAFKCWDIPAWKAFIPVYTMWVAYKEIENKRWLFWIWLITSIPRMILVLLVQIDHDAYYTAFMISTCVSYLTLLPFFINIYGGIISNIYTTCILDMYALAPMTALLVCLIPGAKLVW